MQALFTAFRSSLEQFFDALDVEGAQIVFEKIRACTGTIVLSGVGKSGLIAQKIAATFVSTGTKALFLHPLDALHGNLGALSGSDLFLAFSKSGESEELLALMPHVRKKGAFTISVVSNASSRLAKLSDLIAKLPLQKELCPYGLAPTTSTASQLIFGDCLAIALMEARAFSAADFAENHPGGLLGRKMMLKVSDLMISGQDLPLCAPEDLLLNVLHELSKKRCGCVLVVRDKVLQGIFTDGDLRRAIHAKAEDSLQRPMIDLMNPFPRVISPDILALAALQSMESDSHHLIAVLPVVAKGKIIGLIRMHDILQAGLR